MFYEKLAEKKQERKQEKGKLGLTEGAIIGGLATAGGAQGIAAGAADALADEKGADAFNQLRKIEKRKMEHRYSKDTLKQLEEAAEPFVKKVRSANLRGLGQAAAIGGLSYAGLKKLKKVRDEREERGEDRVSAAEKGVGGAAKLYAAKKVLDAGAERTLGVQRFVHGTSDKAAKSILEEGLKASHGGSAKGSSAALGDEQFVEESKGKIHIFKDTPVRRRLARGHANLAESGGGVGSHIRGIVGVPGQGSGGSRIYGAMPFEEFEQNFEIDPDYEKPQGPKGPRKPKEHGHGIAHRSIVGKDADIASERLSKKRIGLAGIIKNRSKDLGGYISRNKGRFALGLGGLGTAGALGYSGAKDVMSAVKRKEEKKTAAFVQMLTEE